MDETVLNPLAERPVEIEVVRSALTRLSFLAQALSSAGMGDPEHHSTTFATILHDALEAHRSTVVLVFASNSFWYAGTEVSGHDIVTRTLHHSLEQQGLASITLLPGVRVEELIELANLLARPRIGTAGNDLEADAWSLSLEHIHVDTIGGNVVAQAAQAERPVAQVERLMRQLGVDETVDKSVAVELGATLAGLRALSDAPRAATASATDTGATWARILRDVRANRDCDDDILGLLVIEGFRCAGSDAETTELADVLVRRIQKSFADGDPATASALLHRMMICADAPYRPPGVEAATIAASCRGLASKETARAIRVGVQFHPQIDDWVGPLFLLGSSAAIEQVDLMATWGRHLPASEMRTALADGLVLAIDRHPGTSLREKLAHCADAALPTLLRAAARFGDPTLVEPILARATHEDADVREAVFVALRAHQSPRIRTVARKAVDDAEHRVRMEALRYLAVYRDAESADVIGARIKRARPTDAGPEEMRALALAWLHTSRGAAAAELEALAADNTRHPDGPAAAIAALATLGAPGKAALDRLGRAHEHIRPLLREYAGSRPSERRP